MQKIRPISQKFTEILGFENFEIMRFLRYKGYHLDLVLFLLALKMMCNLGSIRDSLKFPRGGGVKKRNLNGAKIFIFDI